MINEPLAGKTRRLAIIDTTFPWKQSGFRYWENMEFYNQKPDTLFLLQTCIQMNFRHKFIHSNHLQHSHKKRELRISIVCF